MAGLRLSCETLAGCVAKVPHTKGKPSVYRDRVVIEIGRVDYARNRISLALVAEMRIAVGDPTTPTATAIYQASWDIKAMDPIPAGITAEHHWP